MTFSLLLALQVVAVVVAVAVTIGGAVLIVIGATRLMRKPAPPRAQEPGYSEAVDYDGPEQVPAGFEDSPRWLDADVTSDSPGASSHVARYSNADLHAVRRSGIAFLAGGIVLFLVGLVFVTQTWTALA